jgi:hypothetical protein
MIAGRSPAETDPQETFTTADRRSVAVERIDSHWKLDLESRVVETRDLSGGLEELLGKSSDTTALVVRILEWEMSRR